MNSTFCMQSSKASIFISLVLICLSVSVYSQQFGGNPPSLRWNQINTDSVRMIFPVGLKEKASSIARIASKLGITQPTIGNKFRKINIVLQNQTTVSNGYVGLGPRRSEFYLNPLQNSFELGSLPWHEQLALHEFRHVQQYNNFNKGLSRLFSILAGEYGLAFANATAIPNWFWEGDAVFQETQQSAQGRGRLPYFFNGYRSLWAAKKDYSWMKLRNGSLRDYVPNHYQLGYLFVAYGREKYGDSIWAKITDDAARFKSLFYPFQGAFKRQTGESFTKFREEALSFYSSQLNPSLEDPVNKKAGTEKHFRADEEYPQWISENELVYVTSSYSAIPSFVVKNISTGNETRIRNKDISLDNYFSVKGKNLVYSAIGYDSRWGWRDYSEIRMLDLNTGEQKSITHKTKYFAPDINEDGNEIVVIEQNPDGSNALRVINLEGNTIQSWNISSFLFFSQPKFLGSDRIVVAVRNHLGEMNLSIINRKSGDAEPIIPFSMNAVGFPTVQGDTVFFTSTDGEQDQLFAYSKGVLKKFKNSRASNSSTGSYALAVMSNKAAWSDFTSTGFRIQVDSISTGDFEDVSNLDLRPLPVFGIKTLETPPFFKISDIDTGYQAKKFPKGFRLLNFHSWLPTVSDPDYTLTLISENLINTLQTDLYFNYNTNEDSKKVGFVTAYGAFYPWIRAGAAYTKDRRATLRGNRVYFDEVEAKVGVLIPWNFSGGLHFRSLSIGTDYVFLKQNVRGVYKDSVDTRGFGYVASYFSFTNQIQRARQHIFPRFAQTLRGDFNRAITNRSGYQLTLNGWLYFPGIHTNHNFAINAAFQTRDTLNSIGFTNSFPFSRGYIEANYSLQYKLGANYHLPLFYPDWGFGNMVYFLRLRANLFYDHTFAYPYNRNAKRVNINFRSFGGELFFDTKWWNQQPISFGVRYSRLLDAALQNIGANQFEFVLPVNLISR